MDWRDQQQSGEHSELSCVQASGLLQVESDVLRLLLRGSDRLAAIYLNE